MMRICILFYNRFLFFHFYTKIFFFCVTKIITLYKFLKSYLPLRIDWHDRWLTMVVKQFKSAPTRAPLAEKGSVLLSLLCSPMYFQTYIEPVTVKHMQKLALHLSTAALASSRIGQQIWEPFLALAMCRVESIQATTISWALQATSHTLLVKYICHLGV